MSGTRVRGDGYTFNPIKNGYFATSDSWGARGIIRWKPVSTLDITLKGYVAENNPRQDLPYGIGYLANRSDAGGYSRFVPRPELGGRLLRQNEVEADTAGRYVTNSEGLSLTVKADLGDKLTLTSITGYDTGRYRLSPFDCDGSPNNVCAIRYFSRSTNFNQDLRLNYDGIKDIKLIVGAYYGRDTIDTHNQPDFFGFLRPILTSFGVPGSFNNIPIAVGNSLKTIPLGLVTGQPLTAPGACAPLVINPNGYYDARSLIAFQADVAATNSAGGTANQAACAAAGAPPFGPILADQRFRLSRPSTAIYGEGRWDVTDKLGLTVGLRYTWDIIKYQNARTVIYDLAGTGIIASTVPYSFPYNAALPAVNQRQSTGRLSGRVLVDYKLADDVLAYTRATAAARARAPTTASPTRISARSISCGPSRSTRMRSG